MFIWDLLTNNVFIFSGDAPCREGLFNLLAFGVALMAALMLHEIAHGYAALSFGDHTAKLSGRLTLDPTKHFNLLGLLMMLLVGFGWANPVPVNPNNFNPQKKTLAMVSVSLAGVVTNLVLAFFSTALLVLVYMTRWGMELSTNNPYVWQFLIMLGYLMMSLNVSFALFNLLPLFPLDGFRLISCFVPEYNKVLLFLRRYSFYIIIACLFLGNLGFSPISWYVNTVGNWLIGGFIDFWSWLLIGG